MFTIDGLVKGWLHLKYTGDQNLCLKIPKKNIKGTDNRKNTNSKIPKNLKTQDRQNAMKRISKTRQAKMREEEVKSTLKFGVKLVLVLAVVIGCAQLFFMERM